MKYLTLIVHWIKNSIFLVKCIFICKKICFILCFLSHVHKCKTHKVFSRIFLYYFWLLLCLWCKDNIFKHAVLKEIEANLKWKRRSKLIFVKTIFGRIIKAFPGFESVFYGMRKKSMSKKLPQRIINNRFLLINHSEFMEASFF